MKRFVTVIAVLITAGVYAQPPDKMSYQSVIRDKDNHLVTNQPVGMRINILQGSINGKVVYTENHKPTTNDNGLISIEIGGGSGFDTINWGNGPYFIKTETDPTGGINYTIIGTSQLLSVPYALYAKNAGDRYWELHGDTLMTAPGIHIVWGDTADFIGYEGHDIRHYVGELYGGGVVFWVDHTGQHGRIISMIDLSKEQIWSNIATVEIGLKAQSYWDGLSNSNAIVQQEGHTNSAAKLCLDYINEDYGTGIYDDWYLPSIGEASQLMNNLFEVHRTLDSDGNPSTTILVDYVMDYWSSTEEHYTAWTYQCLSFNGVFQQKSFLFPVRAIRTF